MNGSVRQCPRFVAGAVLGVVMLIVACLVPMLALAQDAGCRAPALDLANACLLESGAPVRGFIEQAGGSTAFRIVVDLPTRLLLELVDLPADYDLYLMDAGGGIIGQSVHEGTAPEQLQLAVQPGTYFAIVHSDPSRDADSSRPYVLSLTVLAGQPALAVPVPSTSFPPGARRVVLSDDFDDPRKGVLPGRSTANGIVAYVDGEYRVVNTDLRNGWFGTGPINNEADVVIAIDGRLVGEVDQRFITVGCRYVLFDNSATPSDSYRLIVYPSTQEFEVRFINRATTVFLASRQKSPVIHGGEQWNHFELSCLGTSIVARINGTEVASVEDSALSKGGQIVNIGGPAGVMPHAEARFDNLVVYAP